jgi:flavin reductase (DIM6/NTAB) family NADH-FMN oxidoreductase RutF
MPQTDTYDEERMNTKDQTPAQVADLLRLAMRAWTTGVAIVTAARDGEQHGMTVSSFTSVSLDPPLIAISMQSGSRTRELVEASQAFGVTILSTSQQDLSERFAGRTELGNGGDRLEGLETETFVTGAPFIRGGLAFLDCRVRQAIHAGMNTLYIAEVLAVRGDDHEAPLVYHDRTYRRLLD